MEKKGGRKDGEEVRENRWRRSERGGLEKKGGMEEKRGRMDGEEVREDEWRRREGGGMKE